MVVNMELCDVVDKFGTRTGQVVPCGTKLDTGEYYLVMQVWIRDENNNYLIEQRGLHLQSSPGVWATTAGYVMAGEESRDAAIREVKEELGLELSPSHLKRIDRHVLDNRVEDVWMAEVVRNTIGTPVPGEEIADCKWLSREELEKWVNRGQFFRYSYYGKFF